MLVLLDSLQFLRAPGSGLAITICFQLCPYSGAISAIHKDDVRYALQDAIQYCLTVLIAAPLGAGYCRPDCSSYIHMRRPWERAIADNIIIIII